MSTRNPSIPLHEYPARRIAIIKPSALGDIVHALPVLTALRQRFPEAHIAWVVNRSYEPLLQGHPDLDQVIPFDRGAAKLGLINALTTYHRFFRTLRQGRFDLAIDLQGLFRSGLITWGTVAARKVGLAGAREGARWFYTDVVPVPDPQATHAVDRYWLAAEALGASGPKRFHVPIGPDDHRWAEGLLRGLPRPWLAVGVGSRWVTKRWPTDHFATLVRKAQDRFGGTAIFVGGHDETEAARAVARRLRAVTIDLTGQTCLPRLAAVLARADVMLANDTGPLHLAAALGRPVVAPYTCTKVARNGPYGGFAGAVESRIWCQGSYVKTCPRLDCMSELTPFRLWPVLLEALERWQSTSRSA